MTRLIPLLATGVLFVGLAACGSTAGEPVPSGASPSGDAASATDSPSPAASPTPDKATQCPTATVGEVDPEEIVSARANIFGAGHNVAPDPEGGGGGVLPPVRMLPAGSARVLTFPSVTGCVTPIDGMAGWNGPAGDSGDFGGTNVESYDGIAGLVWGGSGMFLTGVFLGDEEPSDPAPERLVYTRGPGDLAAVTKPEIGQTFYIGDGVDSKTQALRRYQVPAEATRLFLGFVDSYLYVGDPGWYGNNRGQLHVVTHVDVE